MRYFCTYPNPPASMQASTNSFSRCTVRKTNCALEPDSRILHIASIPFKIGMVISVTITSGQRLRACSTNAAPSAAVPTTSKWPDRSARSASNRATWSSATRTRGRIKGHPRRRLETVIPLAGWQTAHLQKRMLIQGRFPAGFRATREIPSYGPQKRTLSRFVVCGKL